MIGELKDYERAVYTFQAAKNRYPGDVKNYGTFGDWSNYQTGGSSPKPYYAYQASDFPSDFLTEFQKTAGAGILPNYESAPFVELYNEGIIDFRPLGNERGTSKDEPKRGMPSLNQFQEPILFFFI